MRTAIFKHSKLFEILVLLFIIFFGIFLYTLKINTIPPALSDDEVSMGYNAYSISKSGKDEFGKRYPLSFRLFQPAYGPPLLIYPTAAIISLNGLNPFSIRLVSIISGILSIVVIFYFTKSLNLTKSFITPYLGAFIHSITPWAILYSRSGYEAMLPYFLYILGILLLWLGFKKNYLLTIGLIILSLSVYTGVVNKFLVPLTIIAIFLFFYKTIFQKKSRLFFIGGALIALLIQIPNLTLFGTSAFIAKNHLLYTDIILNEYSKLHTVIPSFLGIPYLFVREFLSQFFNYFSLRSLFLDPDPFPPRSIPELSVFYPWMFIPYLLGLYFLWQKRRSKGTKFIVLISIVSAIPVSLTKDPFWTYRALPLLFPLITIIILGLDKLLSYKKIIINLLLISLILYSLATLGRSYFTLLPNERAKDFGYGFDKLAKQINSNKDTQFVIDNARNPMTYLHLAMYLPLQPEKLQNSSDPNIRKNYYNHEDANPNYSFDNVHIRGIDWQNDVYKSQVLVGDDLAISSDQVVDHALQIMFEINDPQGKLLYQGYRTNPYQACSNSNIKTHSDIDCNKFIN